MHSSVMKHSCFTVYKLCGYCLILSFCVGICCLFIACNESTHWNLLSFFFLYPFFIHLFIYHFFWQGDTLPMGKKIIMPFNILNFWWGFRAWIFFFIIRVKKCTRKEIAFPVKLFYVICCMIHTYIYTI